ncbi:hypothetical protein MRBLMI12_000433 [Microbacterium sp. LMI12-1-1.1]|uniref:hypothetical protein n=1 Tax=Microbacterium sp. LMI12-1-1.1 TaxID=3135225 RepID=UPI00342C674F
MNPAIATGQVWRRKSTGSTIEIGNDLSLRGDWSGFTVIYKRNGGRSQGTMSPLTLYRNYELEEGAE